MNRDLDKQVRELESLLTATLKRDDHIAFESLKQKPIYPPFQPGRAGIAEHVPTLTLPPPPAGLQLLMPGARKRYEETVARLRAEHEVAVQRHEAAEKVRLAELARLRREHEAACRRTEEDVRRQHEEIDAFQRRFEQGDPHAVASYFGMVLQASDYPEGFPQDARVAYVPESKQLVVEYQLPTLDVVPEVGSYKYVKSRDELTSSPRPASKRRALYSSVVSQVALRTLHELFEADRSHLVETIVLNGIVDTIDEGTGREVRPCILTVRTSRDLFMEIDLSKVTPEACLKHLNAAVSKSPAELAPVRPVLEFDMVDPRFVEESDVLSTLDRRPNLMDLSPGEFESLITNLFTKMGLEARLTQASRDGGVDCVAYDPRPIFGGKVVIQAKRYKHTVGVSAVRDLYGTLQNEGASKGILVTTSGYGKAAYEFADGKPIELLSGSHLLHLLKEHAGMDAKIDMTSIDG